jgi:hypothetical protein
VLNGKITVDDEFVSMWKEEAVKYFKYPNIFLEGLKKTTKNLPEQPVSGPRFESWTSQI